MTTKAQVALQQAQGQIGVPYHLGGETPGVAFDCSGLVQWAYRQTGLIIPRTTFLQYPMLIPIQKKNIQPGDLLFYYWNDGGPGPGHVVMYEGNGFVVHAPHTGSFVQEVPVFWSGYVGARRVPGSRKEGKILPSGASRKLACPPALLTWCTPARINLPQCAGCKAGILAGSGAGLGAVEKALSPPGLPSWLGALLNGHMWVRIGEVIAGGGLVVAGIVGTALVYGQKIPGADKLQPPILRVARRVTSTEARTSARTQRAASRSEFERSRVEARSPKREGGTPRYHVTSRKATREARAQSDQAEREAREQEEPAQRRGERATEGVGPGSRRRLRAV